MPRTREPHPRLLPLRFLNELEYNPETGAFRWIIPPSNRHRKGWFTAEDLAPKSRRLTIGGYQASRVAWFLMTGEDPGLGDLLVDHRDADSMNNKWSNLRLCDRTVNALNTITHARSGERFIYQPHSEKDYLVNLCCEGGYLGYFKTKEEAIAARNAHPKWALSKGVRAAHAHI